MQTAKRIHWGLAHFCFGVVLSFVLVTSRATAQPLSQATNVFVREFRFVGNTVIPRAELTKVVSTYTNRSVSLGDLEEARRAVTLHYVARGYINSGAVLDDQVLKDGIVTLRIVEGRLSEIRVHPTNNWLRADYVRERLALAAGPPLNMPRLEERLLMLRDNPNVARINAELEPGAALGDGILDVRVTERSPWHMALEAKNDRPPSVGGEILEALISHQNVTGHSDPVEVHWGLIERAGNRAAASGIDNLGAIYRFPLNANDTTMQFGYERNNFAVIEEPFTALGITSESEIYSLVLRHPLIRTPSREFALSLGVDRKSSQSFLLGVPFSFSPGAVNGESTVSVIRFVQEYVERSQAQVLALRSSLNIGVNILGTTEDGTTRDSSFVGWVGQVQYVRRLDNRGDQLILSMSGQWADDPLLSPEQFSIGGSSTVRGYRENQIVRDMGVIGTAEFRFPILYNKVGAATVQLAPFFDSGTGWNVRRPTTGAGDLTSAGIGLLLTPNEQFSAQIYWGHAFRNINAGHNDPQDLGIHFKVRLILF